ncbi:hypothetical protein Trydic_g15982 [Trypoxylus dichotomus]
MYDTHGLEDLTNRIDLEGGNCYIECWRSAWAKLFRYIQRSEDSDLLTELPVVSLDVRKAFDTVSHAAILRALRRLNLDLGLQDYIRSILADAHHKRTWQ